MTGPQIIECEQNSPEWDAARRGIPTASMFHAILAKGKGLTRASYMRKLASEIITGESGEHYMNRDMERGHEMEGEARNFYAFMTDSVPERVGFIRNGIKGCSPDSLLGTDGMLEVKTQRGDLLIETLLADVFPSEHVAQCQGNLWVAEREWIDITIYWPKMPQFVKRARRDEAYIKMLADEVARFNDELGVMVEVVKRYGTKP